MFYPSEAHNTCSKAWSKFDVDDGTETTNGEFDSAKIQG